MKNIVSDGMNEQEHAWVIGWMSESLCDQVSVWVIKLLREWWSYYVSDEYWVSDRMSDRVSELVSDIVNDQVCEWVIDWVGEWMNEWMNEWLSDRISK